ncbi:MAG: tetratricopeptide repeat protein [Melioribacteraceae bacterium]|nr:tetratricopeptide repeat protein [Melioribacteraceae bacterium]
MKIRSLYIYVTAIIVVLGGIFIFNTITQTSPPEATVNFHQNMPDDDIHRGDGENPSKGNVRSDFMRKYNELKEYVANNPDDTAKVLEFANMLSQAHRKDQAIVLFNSILDKDPARVDVMFALGYEYYQLKEFDKAEDITREIIAVNKDEVQAHYNLGAIAIARGDTTEARSVWLNLSQKYPGTDAAKMADQSLKALRNDNKKQL